jgi:hypothetical protein
VSAAGRFRHDVFVAWLRRDDLEMAAHHFEPLDLLAARPWQPFDECLHCFLPRVEHPTTESTPMRPRDLSQAEWVEK